MRKNIIVIIAIILLGAGYISYKKYPELISTQGVKKQEKIAPSEQVVPVSPENISFDTSDNLDQAVQDLNYLE